MMSYQFRYFKNSPEIIRLAILMYSTVLSLCHVEDLLFKRGTDVSHDPKGSAEEQQNSPQFMRKYITTLMENATSRADKYLRNFVQSL